MADNVLDFETRKQSHEIKRKEAKVDALRRAFRLARGDKDQDGPRNKRKKSRKPKK